MIIKPLPSWAIINPFPAFYETESVTAIEQTARVYVKINELIDSYNKYVTQINEQLMELEQDTDKDLNCAVKTIIQLTDNFMTGVNMKIDHQNREIAEHYATFADKVIETVQTVVQGLKDSGELDATLLNAVGDLDTRFKTIEREWESQKQVIAQAIANLGTTYDEYKAALDQDYQETKSALADGVQVFKDTYSPACMENVEYMTGERFNGKPVYTAQNTIVIPDEGAGQTSFSFDLGGTIEVIRQNARYNGATMPYPRLMGDAFALLISYATESKFHFAFIGNDLSNFHFRSGDKISYQMWYVYKD